MTEYDSGISAHRITPSMLQPSELNEGSFHKPADCRPVLYKLSSCANGPEELISDCLSMSSESRLSGSWLSMYKHAVDAHMNRPPAPLARALVLSSPGQ